MNILAAIVCIICFFIACVFGSAAAVMISRDIVDRKLKKQDYWTEKIKVLLDERLSDKKEFYEELETLREEVYQDNLKLNERIMTLNINQQVLENKLVEFLNKK